MIRTGLVVVLALAGGWSTACSDSSDDVTTSETAASTTSGATASTTTDATTTVLPPGEGDGLSNAADDDHVITFTSIGPWSLGDEVDGFETIQGGAPEPDQCGMAGLGGIDVGALGTTTGEGNRGEIVYLYTDEADYRTASGVGTGTSYAALQRIYGDDLVFDSPDGWDQPTDDLLSMYQPVAGVREGDHALTFTMGSEGKVLRVKVSDAENWGDDEGCA